LENGVRTREDGGGPIFGLHHRENLPIQCGMTDIDNLFMSLGKDVSIHMNGEESVYVEYRASLNPPDADFVALFDLKHHSTKNLKKYIRGQKTGTWIFAQKLLCQKLGARFFIVVATNGDQPFMFIEIADNIDGNKNYRHVGTLSYEESNSKEAWHSFWKDTLELPLH